MGRPAWLVTVAALLAPMAGSADAFVTKQGTVGVFDVPTAEVLGPAQLRASIGIRIEQRTSGAWQLAPLPLSAVVGLPLGIDLGLGLRESGLPGDPEFPRPLVSATAKVRALRASGWRPGLAVALSADRLNVRLESSLALVASTGWFGPIRLTATAGAALTELDLASLGPVGGLAALVRLPANLELAAEGLRFTSGWLLGAGLRWTALGFIGLSAGVTWQPMDPAPRITLALSLLPGQLAVEEVLATGQPSVESKSDAEPKDRGPREYSDPRPRFRLKIRPSAGAEGRSRHQQYSIEEPPEPTPAVEPQP